MAHRNLPRRAWPASAWSFPKEILLKGTIFSLSSPVLWSSSPAGALANVVG